MTTLSEHGGFRSLRCDAIQLVPGGGMNYIIPGFYVRYCSRCGLIAAFCMHDAPRETIEEFHALARQIRAKVFSFVSGEGIVVCRCEEEAA